VHPVAVGSWPWWSWRDLAAAGVFWTGRGAAAGALRQAGFVVVETREWCIRGSRGDGCLTFKGIPYGGPVAGRNR